MKLTHCVEAVRSGGIPRFRGFCLFPGKRLRVYGKVTILNKKNVTIGSGCSLNHGVLIQGNSKIVIGNYVTLSQNVMILDAGLVEEDIAAGMERKRHTASPVTIGDHAWIGAGSIILPGVTIGQQAIVAAGAVVTKNVPPRCVSAGVPAKCIRRIGAKHQRAS